MNKQDAMELADKCVAELADALREDQPESLTRYLDAMATFQQYSFHNTLMILQQRPDASWVMGFRAWQRLGRYVKAGEKGIAILAPMLQRKASESEEDSDEVSIDRRGVRGFRVVHVFDLEQTEGEDIPQLSKPEGDPGVATELLAQVYKSLGIEVVRCELPPRILGASSGGKVKLANGLDSAKEFQVLVHELAHELLHHGSSKPGEPLSKKVAETEADAVAYVVCKAHGINALAAISEYIRLYKGDAEVIEQSFMRIRSTATSIMYQMNEVAQWHRLRKADAIDTSSESLDASCFAA